MRRRILAVTTALMVMIGAVPAQAHEVSRSELKELRAVTAPYRSLDAALAAGFVAFSLDPADPDTPTCFDSPDGGMGVHYVRNIDGIVDANDPEAMVYEVKEDGSLKLVAVEYIVPETEVDPANPPILFGHEFHPHPFLPVWILHVWVWRANPSGTFADYNPDVRPCP
ncbi:MAG: hypothetical protein ACFCU2_11355, partial [Acidimicrobiia bacterium]